MFTPQIPVIDESGRSWVDAIRLPDDFSLVPPATLNDGTEAPTFSTDAFLENPASWELYNADFNGLSGGEATLTGSLDVNAIALNYISGAVFGTEYDTVLWYVEVRKLDGIIALTDDSGTYLTNIAEPGKYVIPILLPVGVTSAMAGVILYNKNGESDPKATATISALWYSELSVANRTIFPTTVFIDNPFSTNASQFLPDVNRMGFGVDAPVTPSKKGDTVWAVPSATGQILGWRCTESGEIGNWQAIGVLPFKAHV